MPKITSYQKAREYLEGLIKPYVFQRIADKPDISHDPLARMRYLLEQLGNPQERFDTIVVSGTSGKGSTTYFTARILEKAGYKVGMATSPHLEKINERMQINGKQISDEMFLSLLNQLVPVITEMKQTPFGEPSYFETLLAMGFLYFAQQEVEIAVVEVGLEGKYDGTNVLSPLIFLYTNTSLDHTQILGETVEAIATEGVGGIRHQSVAPLVITGVTQASVIKIFEKKCSEVGSPLKPLGKDFSYQVRKETADGVWFDCMIAKNVLQDMFVSMRGDYQAANATLAIAASLALASFGYRISEKAIREGLETANFPGRFEMIAKNIILDGAHNPAKMQAFIHALQAMYPTKRKVFLLGFKQAKDIVGMLQFVLPVADAIVVTEFHVVTDMAKQIALPTKEIMQMIKNSSSKKQDIYETQSVSKGIEKIKAITSPNDFIVITGSLYLVGEAREYLLS